jgi:hypothetical protein
MFSKSEYFGEKINGGKWKAEPSYFFHFCFEVLNTSQPVGILLRRRWLIVLFKLQWHRLVFSCHGEHNRSDKGVSTRRTDGGMTSCNKDYLFTCILPYNRQLTRVNDICTTVLSTSSQQSPSQSTHSDPHECHDEESVIIYSNPDDDESSVTLRVSDLGKHFQFTFIRQLYFLHEADLRNYHIWGYDHDACDQNTTDLGIQEQVNCGAQCHGLVVKKLPSVGGLDVGWGLFTSSSVALTAGQYVAEYVGVLYSKGADPSAYSLFYPSSDGSYEIDALEFGNLSRFINHSSTKNNAVYKHILHQGVIHVICVATQDIPPNCQIFVDYGGSYWRARGITPVDL